MNNIIPAEVFPPGEFIRDELEERGWTQADLAEVMGRPLSVINLIISGKRGVTPETACELASAFDTSPEFWLNLENAYKLSKVTAPINHIRERAAIFENAPIKEMQKRGWIAKTDNILNLKDELSKFYSGVNLDEFRVAAKSSTADGTITSEQLAWCVRALQLAKSVPAQPYNPSHIPSCASQLRSLATSPEATRMVPRVLSEAGIRFVIVEHLPRTKIDGAALWLGPQWDRPVIALSLRYDRIDSFWHTVCHEISHILHQDSIASVDVNLISDNDVEAHSEIEARANREAAEMLIPKEKLDSFIIRKRPYFSKVSIIQFSNANKIHPGIVAGQIQHRTKNYAANREMLVKVRDIVTAGAMTDGWGTTVAN